MPSTRPSNPDPYNKFKDDQLRLQALQQLQRQITIRRVLSSFLGSIAAVLVTAAVQYFR